MHPGIAGILPARAAGRMPAIPGTLIEFIYNHLILLYYYKLQIPRRFIHYKAEVFVQNLCQATQIADIGDKIAGHEAAVLIAVKIHAVGDRIDADFAETSHRAGKMGCGGDENRGRNVMLPHQFHCFNGVFVGVAGTWLDQNPFIGNAEINGELPEKAIASTC